MGKAIRIQIYLDYSNDCPLALLMLIANQTFPVSPSSFIYQLFPGTQIRIVFPMDNFMLHVQELGKPNNLYICTNNRTWKNVVYSQVLCSSKNIYIYIYLNLQVGHRDTTTMAGN